MNDFSDKKEPVDVDDSLGIPERLRQVDSMKRAEAALQRAYRTIISLSHLPARMEGDMQYALLNLLIDLNLCIQASGEPYHLGAIVTSVGERPELSFNDDRDSDADMNTEQVRSFYEEEPQSSGKKAPKKAPTVPAEDGNDSDFAEF